MVQHNTTGDMITGKMIPTGRTTTLKNMLYGADEFDTGFSLMVPNDFNVGIYPGKLGNCVSGNGTLHTYAEHVVGGVYEVVRNSLSFWLSGYMSITGSNYDLPGTYTLIVDSNSGITIILEDENGYFVRRTYYGSWSGWNHFVFVFIPDWPYPYIVDVYVNNSKLSMNIEDFGEPSPWFNYGGDSWTVTLNGSLDQYAVWQTYRNLTEEEIALLYNIGNGLPYSQW